MKKPLKTMYRCSKCGYQSAKWLGRCPDCGEWDLFVEEMTPPPNQGNIYKFQGTAASANNQPVSIDQIDISKEVRFLTGIPEFDRVLGGGLVVGSLILIGGDPGIGKSTLMLQVLHGLAQSSRRVLYVSGEESIRQIRIRSRRLNTVASDLLVAAEIDLAAIMAMVDQQKPDVLVIDSIQTMYNGDLASAPGSVTQVRESTMRLMVLAKNTGIPVFLVGHVTKDGTIAGPRVMEHMVDTVLYFEGDRNHVFRILRAVKNRFGSTNEIGVFEMKEGGLAEVPNPSAVFLSERPSNASGSVVTACMEGTRPILVELQALVSGTAYASPRRTILGLEQNRIALLVAVMEKKLGMHLMGQDIFMNVAGGVKIDEPAVDLGIIAAIASSFLDKPVPEGVIILGEVGLTGEVRAIGKIENRIMEAAKMGFSKCVIPAGNSRQLNAPKNIILKAVEQITDAVEYLF